MAILTRLVQLGLPIALALFFEVTLFAVVALLVSPLGIVNVAGHQIALNFSSLMFVLPMSLAAAVTIRVGFRLGQGSTLMRKRRHVPGWAWASVWQPVPHSLPSHCVSNCPAL
jgi:Na+-driven multidrug efflux pump